VKKKLAEKKYLKKDRKEIEGLVWLYLWSATDAELEQNREEMKARLRDGEVKYLINNWFPKEKQLIRLYI